MSNKILSDLNCERVCKNIFISDFVEVNAFRESLNKIIVCTTLDNHNEPTTDDEKIAFVFVNIVDVSEFVVGSDNPKEQQVRVIKSYCYHKQFFNDENWTESLVPDFFIQANLEQYDTAKHIVKKTS